MHVLLPAVSLEICQELKTGPGTFKLFQSDLLFTAMCFTHVGHVHQQGECTRVCTQVTSSFCISSSDAIAAGPLQREYPPEGRLSALFFVLLRFS